MKNMFKGIVLMLVVLISMTGCVKFNATMDIKKDKSMDFKMIYAFDSSMFGEKELLSESEKKEMIEKGFEVQDYNQDGMKGFVVSKKIKNIDKVSSSEDVEYSLSGILENNEDNAYLFKIKKGLLKNTYTAKFEFDASDSDLSTNGNDYGTSMTNTTDDDWSFSTDDSIWGDDSSSSYGDTSSGFDFGNMDYSQMMGNMDLSFTVNLPYTAKSNNATNTTNNDKNLSWSLAAQGKKYIEFEFEIYNMTVIYIGALVLVVLVILAVVVLSKKKGNKNSKINANLASSSGLSMSEPIPVVPLNTQVSSTNEVVGNNTPISSNQTISTDSIINEQSNVNMGTQIPTQSIVNSTSVGQPTMGSVGNMPSMSAMQTQSSTTPINSQPINNTFPQMNTQTTSNMNSQPVGAQNTTPSSNDGNALNVFNVTSLPNNGVVNPTSQPVNNSVGNAGNQTMSTTPNDNSSNNGIL